MITDHYIASAQLRCQSTQLISMQCKHVKLRACGLLHNSCIAKDHKLAKKCDDCFLCGETGGRNVLF